MFPNENHSDTPEVVSEQVERGGAGGFLSKPEL
jgi:hypothetical protein